MAVSNWELQNNRLNNLITKLTDEELAAPTAPGRNSGSYILGHLIAVSDGLFVSLQLGEKLHPELETIFLRNPENSGLAKPSITELRAYWNKVNDLLSAKMNAMDAGEWFAAHTAVSVEDFAREPHRNKLNIVINRTNHLSYHLGQLMYLVKK